MLFRDGLTGLRDPIRIADVIATGLDQYDAVFVPGGHGPMIDLLDDPNAGIVMRHFSRNVQADGGALPWSDFTTLGSSEFDGGGGRAECGRCAAGAHAKAQGWIYSGYKMTIFSTAEEQRRGLLRLVARFSSTQTSALQVQRAVT